MKTVSDRRYTEACNPLGSYWSFFGHFDFERDSWLNSDYLSLCLCLLCSCSECELVYITDCVLTFKSRQTLKCKGVDDRVTSEYYSCLDCELKAAALM